MITITLHICAAASFEGDETAFEHHVSRCLDTPAASDVCPICAVDWDILGFSGAERDEHAATCAERGSSSTTLSSHIGGFGSKRGRSRDLKAAYSMKFS
jgi:hypothetical protein